jgi:hypothetical protein
LTLFYNHIDTFTTGTDQLLDCVTITLDNTVKVYIDVYNNSLSRKWLAALNTLLSANYHLEKNYCFFGFADGPRNGPYLLQQINASIAHINAADLGYTIADHFDMSNSVVPGEIIPEHLYPLGQRPRALPGDVDHDHFNQLHRYFEDLQGVSGRMTQYYDRADAATRWHIRQLNLLCHEFESWALSRRKQITAPAWQRPSQLMCWLAAPRFELEPEDYLLFGIETMNRPLGGVYVGVNKAVGKHHWEVFVDEAGYDPTMIIENLTTTTLRSQLEAAGDFDIEWANNPGNFEWQQRHLADFRTWLINNGFDPKDPSLTIGHPQIGQVDLLRSFGTEDYREIWAQLNNHLNVTAVETSATQALYPYNWSDPDYAEQQIAIIGK